MTKRSITDDEIALIKGMIRIGMKNKDIQFYFNRPNRAVNSGRISGIGNGSYSNSNEILAASDEKIADFIRAYVSEIGTSVQTLPEDTKAAGSRTGDDVTELFVSDESGLWRLKQGETDQHECKSGFGFKHADKWLRAIAALANNRGGYVLFGVHDKGTKGPEGQDLGYVATGLGNSDFQDADPADFSTRLKSFFDPTPRIRTSVKTIGSATIGVIHVEQHPSRPIIATKNEGSIREGDIFYRYPGQSSRITYSDLRAILDDRDLRAREQILPMVERLLTLGPSRAMVADLEAGSLTDGRGVIQIDKSLLEKINFIKEGEFSETNGTPTLRLVGDVQSTTPVASPPIKGVITRSDLIADFLNQTNVQQPSEYLRFALEATSGEWLPIRYFAKLAGMSTEELLALVDNTNAAPGRKATYRRRIADPNAAYENHGGTPAEMLQALERGETLAIENYRDASFVGRALQGLQMDTTLGIPTLLDLLMQSWRLARGSGESVVRRAVCRADEVFFGL
ncbi:AlbA family DNA-binding domain-containing protein [Kaistia granuli]|uniref:AlbA family DNA-binding domain-containing protein n=1 Tax=Kaistia granuli TaxID=363259 RepID=UPI0003A82B98|nr:ATP-binding protein [Kaistia granuli]